MPNLAISTWSLHRALGPMYHPAADGSGRLVPHDDTPGSLSLLQMPAQIAARGIPNLEVCHFHFSSLDQAYLADFRAALADAGVNLYSILIDRGDITHPDPAQRAADLAWIRTWITIAGQCGAAHARIIAGDAEVEPNGQDLHDHAAVRLSAQTLRELAQFGRDQGVQVITENFHALTKRPEPLVAILDLCQGEVGLCADFGNYKAASKYDDLAAILPYATSVHAKGRYSQAGQIDLADVTRCLDLARAVGFAGAYSLIFDDQGDEWQNLMELKGIVASYL